MITPLPSRSGPGAGVVTLVGVAVMVLAVGLTWASYSAGEAASMEAAVAPHYTAGPLQFDIYWKTAFTGLALFIGGLIGLALRVARAHDVSDSTT